MANLTFKETTIDFKFTNSLTLPPVKYLSGNIGDERLLMNYDLYVNGDKIDAYNLTVVEEGNTSDYKLYYQDKNSDVSEVFRGREFNNFPFNVMFGLYSTISSLSSLQK